MALGHDDSDTVQNASRTGLEEPALSLESAVLRQRRVAVGGRQLSAADNQPRPVLQAAGLPRPAVAGTLPTAEAAGSGLEYFSQDEISAGDHEVATTGGRQ